MASDQSPARLQHVETVLQHLLTNCPIYGYTLSTLELVSVTRGATTTRLRLTERHVNSKGGLHGAVSATIVDLTTGLAIASWDGRETTGASVNMHLSYLSTARVGDLLRIETTAERIGGSLATRLSRWGTTPKQKGSQRRIGTDTIMTSSDEPRFHVAADDLVRFIDRVLQANGAPPEHGVLVARCLVAADLRGVESHGANRLPSYVRRIRSGVLDPAATPVLEAVTPAAVLVDGANGFGFVAAHAAMDAAISAARIYGIGLACVRRSNHYGMAAWIVRQALDEGMMSLVFTNSSPAMAPFGGRSSLLGVSPMACGAPGRDGDDFILDMAPSVAARGKIHTALRRGEPIPSDWALDADGNPTEDPAAALDGGVMQPVGGPKGSALAVMMDVFSGVLSGSAFAGNVTGPYDPSRPADVGHFLVAIRPDLFMPLKEFRDRMRYLHESVVGAERAPGVDRIYFPGEIEQLTQRERERSGIPLAKTEVEALNREGAEVSVEPLRPL
ncbi:hypothetical protein XA68_16631 [Ophiocordyceps unilateralis]|uniref:Thioesterase domain-containing protein n=1 Tax=Ophiocordyceps unilateralis TaxID=268505 RepID=A0A2A9PSL0_OPHUN|nr:hypothetical protein XA68_16631 [Ophiocordyceps unilateralis]